MGGRIQDSTGSDFGWLQIFWGVRVVSFILYPPFAKMFCVRSDKGADHGYSPSVSSFLYPHRDWVFLRVGRDRTPHLRWNCSESITSVHCLILLIGSNTNSTFLLFYWHVVVIANVLILQSHHSHPIIHLWSFHLLQKNK